MVCGGYEICDLISKRHLFAAGTALKYEFSNKNIHVSKLKINSCRPFHSRIP